MTTCRNEIHINERINLFSDHTGCEFIRCRVNVTDVGPQRISETLCVTARFMGLRRPARCLIARGPNVRVIRSTLYGFAHD